MLGEEQKLAITIGGLLLVGGVLISQALLGTWPTFSVAATVFVGAYVAPRLLQELTIRRFGRQLRRQLGAHRRP
ncbi:hypothetical protein GCM10009544_26200 [Streptomyces stramineus]|uniref:Uncharacterized protein n=1 Tax=Streptomyces stramineus TaxID=173861 RepID=A0ABN0ZXQ8_9ACTN